MKALLITDLQNDFMPGGALGVPQGDVVVPLANRLQTHFDLVVATQDWHPANHASFAANHHNRKPGDQVLIKGMKQTLWPVHCVQNSHGAKLVPNLQMTRINRVFTKGTDTEIDSYSAFFDNGHLKATGLGPFLKTKKVNELYMLGLATDYCVKFSALDARMLGFKVIVIEDACRGINLNPGDVDSAINEMKKAGVNITRSSKILGQT